MKSNKPIQNPYSLTLISTLPNGELIFKLNIVTFCYFKFVAYLFYDERDSHFSTIKGDRGVWVFNYVT